MLFGFSASSQEVTVIHFNYKWNDRNSYNIRGLKNAKLHYAWLEEQPESVKSGIKTVPVVVILKNGKVKGQFAADLSFEIKAKREEIQDFINKVVEDK